MAAGNVQQSVPLLGVSNLQKSIAYYVDGIGFEKKDHWIDEGKMKWCWLQIDQAALMLQEFDDEVQRKSLGAGVDLYFICQDALKIYETVKSNGLKVSEPFVGNQMWVVTLEDPDGYSVLFESETDVEEETTYSEWVVNK